MKPMESAPTMPTPLLPSGSTIETLAPGDCGFREARHLTQAANTFDQAAALAPPAAAEHPRPDVVSSVRAGAMALKVAETAERLTEARRRAAAAPPTAPALDASDSF